LQRRADGPFLDRRIHDLVALAELRGKFARQRLFGADRGEQVFVAAQKVVNPGEPRRDHGGRRDAVAGTHAAEIEGLLYVLAVALPVRNAGCLLGRERKRMAYPARIEPQHRGRRRGRPECGRQAVGAVAFGVELAEAERDSEPRADVVAERDRA
jgi:hypothetical protein